MVIIAAASMSLFLQTFGGSWTCTTYPPHNVAAAPMYRSTWKITGLPGNQWSSVSWGPPNKYGGIAYVGYSPTKRLWLREQNDRKKP